MWTRAELKSYAKAKLEYNYWPIVGVTFLVGLIVGITNIEIPVDQLVKLGYISDVDALFFLFVNFAISLVGIILGIFLFGPLQVGLARYYINQSRIRIMRHTVYDVVSRLRCAGSKSYARNDG